MNTMKTFATVDANPYKQGKFTPERSVHHTHEGSIGNLCNDDIAHMIASR